MPLKFDSRIVIDAAKDYSTQLFISFTNSDTSGLLVRLPIERGSRQDAILRSIMLGDNDLQESAELDYFLPRNNFEEVAEGLMKSVVKAYQSDFYKYDIPRFRNAKRGVKFVWQLREHGTFLIFETDSFEDKNHFAFKCENFHDESVFVIGEVCEFATFRIIDDDRRKDNRDWQKAQKIILTNDWTLA